MRIIRKAHRWGLKLCGSCDDSNEMNTSEINKHYVHIHMNYATGEGVIEKLRFANP